MCMQCRSEDRGRGLRRAGKKRRGTRRVPLDMLSAVKVSDTCTTLEKRMCSALEIVVTLAI